MMKTNKSALGEGQVKRLVFVIFGLLLALCATAASGQDLSDSPTSPTSSSHIPLPSPSSSSYLQSSPFAPILITASPYHLPPQVSHSPAHSPHLSASASPTHATSHSPTASASAASASPLPSASASPAASSCSPTASALASTSALPSATAAASVLASPSTAAVSLAPLPPAPSDEQSGPRLLVVLGLVGGGGVLVLLLVALVSWLYHRRAMLEGANVSAVYSSLFQTADSSVPLLSRDESDEDDAHINP